MPQSTGFDREVMATKTCSADPLWRWTSSLDRAQKETLLQAVDANRAFARATAWSYLHDEQLGGELIERALESVHRFAANTTPAPSVAKLTSRLRSQIRRVAKQQERRVKELHKGSLRDLELLSTAATPDPVEYLFLEEVVGNLSPQGREVASYIRLGYTWRDIGTFLGVDHSALRKSFRRETDAALVKLGRGVRIER